MYEIKMPKFGLNMEEGIIEQWFKQEGDNVKKGEPLMEISSDKIINQIESPVSGKIIELIGEEGETYKVGEVIGIIEEENDSYETTQKKNLNKKQDKTKISKSSPNKENEGKKSINIEENALNKKTHITHIKSNRIKISPIARKTALKYGIDITKISGTGPGGRIILKDIENFLKIRSTEGNEFEEIKLSGIRKTIAKKLSDGFHSAVTVTNVTKIDFTNFLKWVKHNNITVTSGIIYFLKKPLTTYKKFNSHFDGEKLKVFKNINIGIAVDTTNGLIVPVIKNVEQMDFNSVNSYLKEISLKARNNEITQNDLIGSTFSITNLGMMDTILFTPVINPPEVAIMGIGTINKEFKIFNNNSFSIRDIAYISLSYDHRIIDGADAARFLIEFKKEIENVKI